MKIFNAFMVEWVFFILFFSRTVHFFLEFCIVIIIVTISQNLKNGLAEVELPP